MRNLKRMLAFLFVFGLVLSSLGSAPRPAHAQDPHGQTDIATNIRNGPGQNYEKLTTLNPGIKIIIEARNNDTSWILFRTADGAVRGWGKTRLFTIYANISLYDFPTSGEILAAVAIAAPAGSDPSLAPGPLPSGNAPLNAPYVPKISAGMRSTLRALMAKGKELGNNYRVFSKVGDCQTDHHSFLKPFGWNQYNLGEYGYLQEAINYFMVSPRPDVGNAFDAQSIASSNGFNSSAVQQPEFAPASVCQPGEKPLTCEYRLNKPGIAIIMFGTADVLVMSPQQFETFMKTIIKDTMALGIIPVLSTFPENNAVAVQSRQLNQIVIRLGAQKNIPVINFADAVRSLPNNGLEPDGIHLTNPPGDNAGVFAADTLQYGFTMRNLVVLQTLDALMRQVLR
jgi:hypothetical protein